ncbi:hypothetical protein HYFRA_00011013 [Hymenoscyphus fraxineus]|uniref:NACHT domain-containing protein n=1 Tax=Hymenoscyphus fraxineus TaxID=746836 RepID=A0A9N9PVM9_9HELO|nr:hypothetical protein HYFRA_00011013 [Hymenoscyphus fraxineus]
MPPAMVDQHSEPYDEAHVLLLGWEHDDDDINNNKDMRLGLEKLEVVLERFFNYRTYSQWRIPQDESTDALNTRLREFRTAHNKRRNLLIVYYAGHGAVDHNRSLLWLMFNSIKFAPRVTWNALQTVFLADTVADVLIIMDCCNALAAFQPGQSVQSGTAMLWAACGPTYTTPVSGPACFTENLIAVLEDVNDEGRDVDDLNGHLFWRLDNIQTLNSLQVRSVPACMTISHSQDNRRIRIKKIPKLEGDLLEIPVTTAHEADLLVAIPTLSNDRDEPGGEIQGFYEIKGSSAPGTLTPHSANTSDLAKHEVEITQEAEKVVTSVSVLTSQAKPPTHADGSNNILIPPVDIVEDNRNGTSNSEGVQVYQQKDDSSRLTPEYAERPSRVTLAPSEEVHPVMRRLWFNSEDFRKHSIGNAYPKTFHWITEHEGFLNWTKGSEPFFWVSGLPGSGKSTLMKHLVDYFGLQRMFQNWNHGNQVLTASFFFWAPGMPLDKSCEGCLRSLLFQIMNQDPDTVAYAFRFFHRASRYSSGDTQYSLYDLRALLEALIQDERSPMRTKYWCIFLDGLDECDDWDGISDIVLRVLRGPHIKVCVSSRPSILFAKIFQYAPKLQMQDLTYYDILTFVQGELNSTPWDDSYEERPQEVSTWIARRAEGVFLWAALATHTVMELVEEGCTWQYIRAATEEIPITLRDLYLRLLHDLTPVTAKTLLVAQACEVDVLDIQSGATVQLVLTTTLLVFALENSTQDALTIPIQPESREEMSERAERIAHLLRDGTNGLVTIDMYDSDDHFNSTGAPTISYMHKTAHDFLTEFDVMHRLRQGLLASQFNPHLALLRAVVLDVKTQNLENLVPFTDISIDTLSSLPFWMKIEQAIRYAQIVFRQCEVDHVSEIVQLLEELDRVVQIQLETWSKHSLQEHWSSLTPLGAAVRHAKRVDNFLSYATSCGLWEYVSHKLEAGTPLHKPGKPLLFYAIQPQPQFAGSSNTTATVYVLLKGGADPNVTFLGESVWRRFLKTFYLYDTNHSYTEYTKQLREMFRHFILFGADTTVIEAVAAEVRASVN